MCMETFDFYSKKICMMLIWRTGEIFHFNYFITISMLFAAVFLIDFIEFGFTALFSRLNLFYLEIWSVLKFRDFNIIEAISLMLSKHCLPSILIKRTHYTHSTDLNSIVFSYQMFVFLFIKTFSQMHHHKIWQTKWKKKKKKDWK